MSRRIMLLAENLAKTYAENGASTRALQGVHLEIREGEFVAIMGPSGSGKSTLLHILSFLDRPTDGTYTFFGKDMADLSDADLARARNREMGFVFQSFNLLARSTVYHNVELPLLYADAQIANRNALVERAVAAVGLTDKLQTEAGKLSGGEKQRVAIARALVLSPRVIFADEPTGNLDSEFGGQVMDILRTLHRQGRTIVLVTHETYTAEYASRIIRLKDGAIESDHVADTQRSQFIK